MRSRASADVSNAWRQAGGAGDAWLAERDAAHLCPPHAHQHHRGQPPSQPHPIAPIPAPVQHPAALATHIDNACDSHRNLPVRVAP
eukprot:297650-Rhodomonas_salina.2